MSFDLSLPDVDEFWNRQFVKFCIFYSIFEVRCNKKWTKQNVVLYVNLQNEQLNHCILFINRVEYRPIKAKTNIYSKL